MPRSNMSEEQKELNRYELMSDEVFIFVHNSMIPWGVRDISMGGLSFHYSPVRGEKMASGVIDIVAGNRDQGDLTNIMCSMVYDNLNLSEGLRFRGKETRRRGLKFDQLTQTQTRSLGVLLDTLRIVSEPIVRDESERHH